MFGRIGKLLVALAMMLNCSVAAVARPIQGEGDIVFGWSGYLQCSKGGPLSGKMIFIRSGGNWAGYIDVYWVKHHGNGGPHKTLLFSLKPKMTDKPIDDTKALVPVPERWVDTPAAPTPDFKLADVTYGRGRSFVDITLRSAGWSCDEQTWEQTGGDIFDVQARHIRQLSEQASIAASNTNTPATKSEGGLTGSDLFALFLRSILNSKSNTAMETDREWAAKEERKQRRRQEELNCKLAKIAANNPNHLECYDFRPD